jgi:adenylate cyclase class 2
MPLEIEAKFSLADPQAMRKTLREAGARPLSSLLEHNVYFDRPDGSLRRDDCGLRLRTEQAADGKSRTLLTYKGPRQSGQFKIRQEEEVTVDSAAEAEAILKGLGFEPTLSFHKRRENYHLAGASISLDELPELGFFLEIEAGDECTVALTRQALHLEDQPTITKTYLALVAEHLPPGKKQLNF